MKVIDTHCDALMKLQLAKHGKNFKKQLLDYKNAEQLDTNLIRFEQGGVKVQFFAVFVSPDVPSDEEWGRALEQIDLFYTEVLEKNPRMKHITKWKDLDNLQEDEIGAVLALEGAGPFGNDLGKLRHLYRLGVLSVGLTWNHANLCADGAKETRGGGLTLLGKDAVKLNNEYQVLTDVSHLSVKGFWDVMELAEYPFASHSNARSVVDHPRNLYDDQAKAMFEKGGMIDVVFNPPFVAEKKEPEIQDVVRHIDHFCSLGGEKHIGFGSDFDGISSYVRNLEDASKYPNLINELLKHFTEDQVKGFAYQNFLDWRPAEKE